MGNFDSSPTVMKENLRKQVIPLIVINGVILVCGTALALSGNNSLLDRVLLELAFIFVCVIITLFSITLTRRGWGNTLEVVDVIGAPNTSNVIRDARKEKEDRKSRNSIEKKYGVNRKEMEEVAKKRKKR